MEHKTFGAVSEKEDLFSYNEERANHYAATCLKFAAIVSALMWILNILGFFIVDKTSMNIVMPTGILLFLLPAARKRLNLKLGRGEKYFIVCCFLLGISAMSFVLTLQMIMAWTCPIVLSCHYYSPPVHPVRRRGHPAVHADLLLYRHLYRSLGQQYHALQRGAGRCGHPDGIYPGGGSGWG